MTARRCRLFVLTTLLASACDSGGPAEPPPPPARVVTTIEVTPGSHTLSTVGAKQQFTAVAKDAAGAVMTGQVITWSAQRPAVAQVDAGTGVATATGNGETAITAAVGTVSGSATLRVAQVTAAVAVSPANQEIGTLGGTRTLTATAKDSAGVSIPGAAFTWTSSDSSIVRVQPASGLVTARANGTAVITARNGSTSANATVHVRQVVASLTITPALDTILAAGQTQALSATAHDSGTSVIAAPPTITWTSSNASVATIDAATGLATAAGVGSATITARSGSVTHTATLVVRNGTLVGDYVLLTDFGNTADNAYLIDGIFAVWWDRRNDYAADARIIIDRLKGIRAEALALGLRDPPNPAFGTYVNIYIHVPGADNDNYPATWGNGVGTDGNRMPYMSLPTNVYLGLSNTRHEAFHIFQYSQTSPGFVYASDSAWFTEASANWFAAIGMPGDIDPFVAAATIPANPQQALWHAFNNAAPGDRANWNRQVRQYAMNTWLHYLTTAGGAPVGVIADGFNAGTALNPQEYLLSRVPNLRAIFADWAAHNTADMDYLTRAQWTAAQREIVTYGEADDVNPYVATLANTGTGGTFFEPAAALLPRGWAYNVIRIANASAATYRFELAGAPAGSEGAAARFEARALVRSPGSDSFHAMTMSTAQDGVLIVNAPATATDVIFIVVSVPQHFRGNQTYPYRVRIDRT